MVMGGFLCMSTDDFTHNDVLALIVHCVWTDLISAYVFFILFFFTFTVCTFCTISILIIILYDTIVCI